MLELVRSTSHLQETIDWIILGGYRGRDQWRPGRWPTPTTSGRAGGPSRSPVRFRSQSIRHGTGPTKRSETAIVGSVDHRQDARLDGFRQRRPGIDHGRQFGVKQGFPCAECAAFCAALVRNPRFPVFFVGGSSPVIPTSFFKEILCTSLLTTPSSCSRGPVERHRPRWRD